MRTCLNAKDVINWLIQVGKISSRDIEAAVNSMREAKHTMGPILEASNGQADLQ